MSVSLASALLPSSRWTLARPSQAIPDSLSISKAASKDAAASTSSVSSVSPVPSRRRSAFARCILPSTACKSGCETSLGVEFKISQASVWRPCNNLRLAIAARRCPSVGWVARLFSKASSDFTSSPLASNKSDFSMTNSVPPASSATA